MAARRAHSITPAWRGDETPLSRASTRLLALAIAFAIGIAIGEHAPTHWLDHWLIASATFLALATMCSYLLRGDAGTLRRRDEGNNAATVRSREATEPDSISTRASHSNARGPFILRSLSPLHFLLLTATCFGAAWTTIRHDALQPHDLTAWMADETRLVRIEGIALASPTVHDSPRGSFGLFDYRGPAATFPMQVEAVIGENGDRTPAIGNVFVRINEIIPPLAPGDRVGLTGHLRPLDPPRNPGDFDRAALARALNQAGILDVTSRALLEVTPANRPGLVDRWLGVRESLHRRAAGVLLSHLPNTDSPHREALLTALLLGQRDPELDMLHRSFRHLGIAHLLAISGLHLGIVVGFIVLLLRMLHIPPRVCAFAMIAIVLGYLALVEVRMPVLRAGVMTIAICIGLMCGRRLHVGSMIALSGILLLLWRPSDLFNAGFQLSFGVVLGLIYLAPLVYQRLPLYRLRDPFTAAEYIGRWIRGAFAVAITSWLVATPIVMYHFGFIAPLGIVLSVPAVPLVALLLAVGYLKMLLEVVLPSAALLLSAPLSILADIVVATVMAIDEMPGTVWHVPFPSATWTFSALAAVVLIAAWRWSLRNNVVLLSLLLVLGLWLYAPRLPLNQGPALRIDLLSVGHGTCILLQSGGETFVFDAGSMSRFDIGERTIVPTLRRKNVTSIDTIAISHPHIDHYAGIIDLVDAFGADHVLTTHQFLERARMQPTSAIAYALDALTDRYVRIEPIIKGEQRIVGEATLTWLHPPHDLTAFERDNEHSMVIRVDVADRTVLLTGDVERQGLAHLITKKPNLRACVVEIPHHGSYNDLAAAFIEQLDPEVTLQSSNRTQWNRSREQWNELLDGVEQLVTYRDGACTILIHQDGSIEIQRFLEHHGRRTVP